MKASEQRDRLINQHIAYVRKLASKFRRDISADLDLEELVAYGMRGLVEAAERYDPTRGAAFTTFSYYRIRGAIFDGLRELGWLNRSEYARYQSASNSLLENAADRYGPQAQDGVDAVRQVDECLNQLATIFVTTLDEVTEKQAHNADERSPEDAVHENQARDRVRTAVEQLEDKQKQLLQMHYFEGKSLKDAGELLGMSKSWASRLHSRAVGRLAELLSDERSALVGD